MFCPTSFTHSSIHSFFVLCTYYFFHVSLLTLLFGLVVTIGLCAVLLNHSPLLSGRVQDFLFTQLTCMWSEPVLSKTNLSAFILEVVIVIVSNHVLMKEYSLGKNSQGVVIGLLTLTHLTRVAGFATVTNTALSCLNRYPLNGVMVFFPSFLSSQTPAGWGGWLPFLSLVLPEVSSC